MNIKKSVPLTGLLLLCPMAFAHEFWLEPVKFWLKKNEKIRIELMVGEDYRSEDSSGHKYKILTANL